MTKAMVNSMMIEWAIARSRLTVEIIAKMVGVHTDSILDWRDGTDLPTFNQAQKLAKCLSVAFGYFYLQTPPQENIPLADMRTIGDHDIGRLSIDLRDCISDAVEKQEWYKDYLNEHGIEGPDLVGSIDPFTTDVHTAVKLIKSALRGYSRPKTGSFENHFSVLLEKIEDAGVLVLRNSIVNTNTSRALDVNEFRGFALVDKCAPLIFINTADSPEARIFTLVHELVHVFIGQSALSDSSPENNNKLEKYCNNVSAEFLVPTVEFTPKWISQPEENINFTIEHLAKEFRVSRWVIARKAHDLGLIKSEDYWSYIRAIYTAFKKSKADKSGESAVAFPTVQLSRVGKKLARAVSSEALSGNILLRDAHRLIGIRPSNLKAFAKKEFGF